MRPEDRRYIVPTWVRSFADYAPWGPSATRAHHAHVVDALLDDPTTRVMVLASDEAARTLHGWAAATASTLHYVYVPPELRGQHLGERCITAALGSYPKRIETSHPWPMLDIRYASGRVIGQRAHSRFRWNPYALQCAALKRAA